MEDDNSVFLSETHFYASTVTRKKLCHRRVKPIIMCNCLYSVCFLWRSLTHSWFFGVRQIEASWCSSRRSNDEKNFLTGAVDGQVHCRDVLEGRPSEMGRHEMWCRCGFLPVTVLLSSTGNASSMRRMPTTWVAIPTMWQSQYDLRIVFLLLHLLIT